MSYSKNIKLTYIITPLLFANLAASTILIFLKQNGISITQIFILQAVASLIVLLFQMPAGLFADVIGRKRSIALGCVLYAFSSILTALSSTFFLFMICLGLLALATTFYTSADQAIVYDSLRFDKRQRLAKFVFGNQAVLKMAGLGVAVVFGGFIAGYSFRLNFVIMGFLGLVALLFSVRLRETVNIKKVSNIFLEFRSVLDSVYFMILVKPYMFVTLASAILGNIALFVLLYTQLYLDSFNISLVFFGFIYASFALSQGLGSKVGSFIEAFLMPKYFIVSNMLLMGASLVLIAMSKSFFSFLFSLHVFGFFSGFFLPVLSDYQNRFVPSLRRASVASFSAMINSGVFFLMALPLGLITDFFGLSIGLLATAAILALAIPVLGFRVDNEIIINSFED